MSSASAFAEGTHPDQVSRAVFVTAPDGLRLHTRSYGCSVASALPVVCLPALARTTADFHPLAAALAADPPSRGLWWRSTIRIRSQPDNYTVPVALADLSAVLIALEIAPAIFLLAMMLAVWRPTAIAGVILNDIGHVIEPQGLVRIKGYVGKLPVPRSFEEGHLDEAGDSCPAGVQSRL